MSGTAPPIVAGSTIGAAFAEVVAAAAAATPAVIDADGPLTYGDLDTRSAAVAAAVREAPPQPGPALVLADHGADAIVAMLGCARAGAAYLVLDQRAPEAVWRTVVARHGARVLLAGAGFAGRARSLDASAPVVDVAARTIGTDPNRASGAPAATGAAVGSYTPASVSFTSGTAGVPKAVVHSHRSVLANARRYGSSVGVRATDRFVVVSPLATVAAATPVYTGLLHGAGVVLFDVHAHCPGGFADVVAAAGGTIVHVVPAVLAHLAEPPAGGLPGVRLVALGGDRLLGADVERARAWFPRARILHRYSTSETNQIAARTIAADDDISTGVVDVGRVCAWMHVRVLDSDGRACAPGVAGELSVAGPTLALGYLDDPLRTSERFVDGPNGREYRTGDRARRLADGRLELLGRADDVVKVGGVRVDLAALERTLIDVRGVDAAAVVAADHPVKLTAFVTGDVRAIEVRADLAGRLPAAQVPGRVVVVAALPVTGRGKVDRAALADVAAATTGPPYAAPVGATEVAIAAAFAQVLGIDDVGRDDDCFALGADSLAGAELAAAITVRIGCSVDVETLLARPTPALLAAWARSPTSRAAGDRAAAAVVPVASGPADRPVAVLFSGGSGAHLDGVAQLARALRARRCVAVRPRGFAGRARPDRTVSAMAGSARGAIADSGLAGPLVLVGHSVGGTVAVETARQLAAAGQEVVAVVLLDTRAVTANVVASRRLRADLRRALAVNRTWRADRGLGSSWPRRAYWVPRYLWRRLRRRWLAASAGLVPRRDAAQHRAFEAVVKEAVRRWVDTDCPVPVVLVRARWAAGADATTTRAVAADLGWGQVLARSPVVVEVDGDHDGLTTGRFAISTAAAIDAALDDLARRAAVPPRRP